VGDSQDGGDRRPERHRTEGDGAVDQEVG
jgi:hypothetical protein